MNRKLIFFFATLLAGIQAFSQNNKLSYSLKGGLNISSGRVSTGKKYSGTGVGFHAGIVADYKISENFTVQPGTLISMKNASISELNGIHINLVTLDIPVIGLYKKERFFAGVGPDFNIGLTGRYNYEGDKYDLYDKKNDGRFSIKRVEIAASALVGYYIKHDLFVSANYNAGLNNLFNYSEYSGSGTKVKTSVIGLSVGYSLSK